MAQPSKRKVEFMLHQEELPDFLKQLGEEMTSGMVSVGDARIDVSGFTRLALSLKNEEKGVLVKIKIKYDDTTEVGAEDFEEDFCATPEHAEDLENFIRDFRQEKPKNYNSLKKIMKKQFKAIRCALFSGSLPDPALTQQFVQTSEWMCSFPGKGDAYYGSYMEAVHEFAAAVEKQDADSATAYAEKINALKKSCHDKFK